MLKNYFKIAIRQLRRQKLYSAVKTGGFAIGIAACLLIGLYIKEELSYDRSYPDAARIYRVMGCVTENGTETKWSIDRWVFALAGGTVIIIAFFTVSFQSVKVEMTNPVNSLRSE